MTTNPTTPIPRIGARGIAHKLSVLRDPSCTLCPLHESSVNVCVMGRGNPIRPIHLIGEAPGEAESTSGLPFMGASGKLLNKLLEKADLLKAVYISNVCRCRPPKNRKPSENEVAICGDTFLGPEISILKPQIIVALGRTATDFLRRGHPFQRGKVLGYKWIKCPVIHTWHPAYCLRSGGENGKTAKDLLSALKLAREFIARPDLGMYIKD